MESKDVITTGVMGKFVPITAAVALGSNDFTNEAITTEY